MPPKAKAKAVTAAVAERAASKESKKESSKEATEEEEESELEYSDTEGETDLYSTSKVKRKKVTRPRMVWMAKLKHRDFFERLCQMLNYRDPRWTLRELFKLYAGVSILVRNRARPNVVSDAFSEDHTSWWKKLLREIIEVFWWSLPPAAAASFVDEDNYLLCAPFYSMKLARKSFEIVPYFRWPEDSWKRDIMRKVCCRVARTQKACGWMFHALWSQLPEEKGFPQSWKFETEKQCMSIVQPHSQHWRLVEMYAGQLPLEQGNNQFASPEDEQPQFAKGRGKESGSASGTTSSTLTIKSGPGVGVVPSAPGAAGGATIDQTTGSGDAADESKGMEEKELSPGKAVAVPAFVGEYEPVEDVAALFAQMRGARTQPKAKSLRVQPSADSMHAKREKYNFLGANKVSTVVPSKASSAASSAASSKDKAGTEMDAGLDFYKDVKIYYVPPGRELDDVPWWLVGVAPKKKKASSREDVAKELERKKKKEENRLARIQFWEDRKRAEQEQKERYLEKQAELQALQYVEYKWSQMGKRQPKDNPYDTAVSKFHDQLPLHLELEELKTRPL
ncbi:unnamed protein product, partial [Amoebophrya sp. A25]|eukprot:GSA25T00010629001.1